MHANLGLIYFQERKFEQAIPALRQALKLKPALTKTGALLAISLSELGRYGEALPGLEKGFHQSAEPAIKRMCGLQLLRAYHQAAARQQCGGSGAGSESALSERSGGPVPHWPSLWELRLPDHAKACPGGSSFDLEASG